MLAAAALAEAPAFAAAPANGAPPALVAATDGVLPGCGVGRLGGGTLAAGAGTLAPQLVQKRESGSIALPH
ncbi:MAG TPA: hypothetical protein VGR63_04160 [Casimicrobiaceae bacterium]|nr:hypothetical protein [Casimicrobiaceae bacterium]